MVTPTQDAPVSEATTIEAGPLTLSARVRRPHQPPRGVIVALHGGTYDSSYYDTGPDSLLVLGAALGYRVEPFPGAGHSIELHRGARAYVLRQLTFAEECLSA